MHSSKTDLKKVRLTIEKMQKALELKHENDPEKIIEACKNFEIFLLQHLEVSTSPPQLDFFDINKLKEIAEKFKQEHGCDLDRFFYPFINLLRSNPNNENCCNKCLEYLVALAFLEETRGNHLQENWALLIHYYTKSFQLARRFPKHISKLRELSSSLLFRILKSSFQRSGFEFLSNDLLNRDVQLQGFKKFIKSIEKLEKKGILLNSDLQSLYELICGAITRLNIPKELHEAMAKLLIDAQQKIHDLSSPTTLENSFVEQLQKDFADFRKKTYQEFSAVYKQLRTSNSVSIRLFQERLSSRFKAFFCEAFLQGPFLTFEFQHLSSYDIRIVGSTGRQELYPYSDLECFVLIKKMNAHFEKALQLLQLETLALGETVADLPGINKPFFLKGFFLDPLDPGPGSSFLVATGERLANRQMDSANENDCLLENFSLLRSESLSSDDPNVFLEYQHHLNKTLLTTAPPLNQVRSKSIIHSLIKEYKKNWSHPIDSLVVLNLKNHFLTPLNYLILSLGVYFDIEKSNSLDILDQLRQRDFFDKESAELIKEVIGALYLIRMNLHFFYRRNCDETVFKPNPMKKFAHLRLLTNEERAWLRRAYYLVILPLYEALESGQIPAQINLLSNFKAGALHRFDAASLDPLKISIFKEYILYLKMKNQQQEIEDLYRYLSLHSYLEPLRYQIYSAYRHQNLSLFSTPNSGTGFRYSCLREFQELKKRLIEMTWAPEEAQSFSNPDGIKASISFTCWGEEIIPQSGFGVNQPSKIVKRYLKPNHLEDLLDKKTLQLAIQHPPKDESSILWLNRCYPKSLHRVVPLQTVNDKKLHFRERPTNPSMEFAALSLIQRLFGRGVTPVILAKLTIELPSGQTYSTAVSISLSQEGDELSQRLKEPEFEKNHGIDPIQYTEQLISQILIMPDDAHGGNFLVTKQNLPQIIALDLEASFVPIRLKDSGIPFVCELFCHNLITHLHPDVLKKFTEIKPGELLSAWLNELLDLSEGWSQLLPKEKQWLLNPIVDPQDINPSKREIQSIVQCLLPPGSIARLYMQITHLKKVFEKNNYSAKTMTPLELLEEIITCWEKRTLNIGKIIAQRYRSIFGRFINCSPDRRLATVVGKEVNNSQSASMTLQSFIGHLPDRKTLESQSYHPLTALKELTTMVCIYEKGVQFNHYGQVFEVQIDQNHQMERETQYILLRLLTGSSGITHLRLPSFTVLNDAWLNLLIEAHKGTLKTIDLTGSENISFTPFVEKHAGLIHLEELTLSCKKPGNFCLAKSLPLSLPNLKKFKCDGNETLRIIALDSPLLSSIKLEGNFTLFINPRAKLEKFVWIKGNHNKIPSFNNSDLKYMKIEGLVHLPFDPKSFRSLQSLTIIRTVFQKDTLTYLTELINSATLLQLHLKNCIWYDQDFDLFSAIFTSEIKSLTLFDNPMLDHLFNEIKNNYFVPKTVHVGKMDDTRFLFLMKLLKGHDKLFKLTLSHLSLNQFKILYLSLPHIQVKRLSLSGCNISEEEGKYLCLSLRYSKQITSFELFENAFNRPGINALGEFLTDSGVKELIMSNNNIPYLGMSQLIDKLYQSKIIKFKLNTNKIVNPSGINSRLEIINQVLPAHIKELDLSRNSINDNALQILAPLLIHVIKINLTNNEISDRSCEAIGELLIQSMTKELDLSHNPLKDSGLIALSSYLPKSKVTKLCLANTSITNKGMEALSKALPNTQITDLDLSYNLIGDEGLESLAKILSRAPLLKLNFSNNKIGMAGIKDLARGIPLSKLIELNLSKNYLGDAVIPILAQALESSLIAILNLSNNEIGLASIQALVPVLKKIIKLDLKCNQINDETMQILARALPQSAMSKLNLNSNKIGSAGIMALAQVLPRSNLTELELSRNLIGDVGASHLALAIPQSKIKKLTLNTNRIGDNGARAIAKVQPESKIAYLELSTNNIGNRGAQAFAGILSHSPLLLLDLSYNKIDPGTKKSFIEVWQQSKLHTLILNPS